MCRDRASRTCQIGRAQKEKYDDRRAGRVSGEYGEYALATNWTVSPTDGGVGLRDVSVQYGRSGCLFHT